MKINEEVYLKKSINLITKFAEKNILADDFYSALDSLNMKSLQDLSFKNDLAFFDEINFILSVITSIVVHPHISNTGEEIILRSDQVGSIQNDMFMKTLKDASLWKHNKEKEMIPEHVHYYQNIDLIRIYENIFIVMLINMLDSELNNYMEFYTNMIMTFTGDTNLSLSDSVVQTAFDKINRLLRKIRRIKETYFYKAVSKGGSCKLSHVRPTNILLKDRLYNYCFKFYRSLITYEDKDALIKDFSIYYYVLILKKLRSLNFKLIDKERKVSRRVIKKFDNKIKVYKFNILKLDANLTLENEKFIVSLSYNDEHKAITLDISNKFIEGYKSTHMLLVDPDDKFDDIKDRLYDIDPSIYLEAISLWNRAYIENRKSKVIRQNPQTEDKLIAQYIDDRFMVVRGSKKIYSTYCPSCKDRSSIIDEDYNICKCDSCSSTYVFENKNEDSMWFIRLRR